ncbi:LacI family DNA-binding transcriptional regulator [Liberiplasma polymorphum]|uniref:LacI family DNA-binding transcriptional regulator n=1 Tax=Liberiplasma polymorphum TaxID=3374570 RepID=UPI0037711733
MSNIKDVAKKAGVGIATVSRVINNSGYVKKETREKIEQVIKEVGYIPNEIARSMTKQRTKIVAFVLPHSNHIFFSELLYFVEKKLYDHGYKLMVCNSGSNREKEIDFISMLKNNRVDGLIFLTSNDIESYLNPKWPIVSFDRHFEGIPYVASDNYSGGRLAAELLLKTNPKSLLFIGDDAQGELSKIVTEVSKRRIGFKTYLEENNFHNYRILEYPQGDLFIPTDYINDIITENQDVDGIFAISDMLAHVVIKQLHQLGKRVPEDVKVIGYDGVKSYLNLGQHITSIGQPVDELAESLVRNIIFQIYGQPAETEILPITYVPGDTL